MTHSHIPSWLLRAAGVCLCLSAAAAPATAEPPKVDFEAMKLLDLLTPGQIRELQARIDYWLDQIAQAKGPKDVLDAREGLLKDFQIIDKAYYKNRFATLAGADGTAMLSKLNGGLKDLQEVNIALAISQMQTVTVWPALNKMVVYANPAVRYYGWRGYLGIRELVLAFPQGKLDQAMYEAMRKSAIEETSAPVVGAVFQMILLPVRPNTVTEQDFKQYQQKTFDILKEAWPVRCRQVMAGDAAMVEACRKAVAAVNNFSVFFASDAERHKQMLQMVLDMAWCSVKAYIRATDAVAASDKKDMANESALRSREANFQLLRDCETTLNFLTQQQGNRIAAALAASNARAAGLAVVEWIDSLKSQGLEDPDRKFPDAPASAESKPAPPGE